MLWFLSSSEGPLVPDDNSVASVAESGSAKGTSSVCVGEEEIGTGDSPLEVQSGKPSQEGSTYKVVPH